MVVLSIFIRIDYWALATVSTACAAEATLAVESTDTIEESTESVDNSVESAGTSAWFVLLPQDANEIAATATVSYTHLTLPTTL